MSYEQKFLKFKLEKLVEPLLFFFIQKKMNIQNMLSFYLNFNLLNKINNVNNTVLRQKIKTKKGKIKN